MTEDRLSARSKLRLMIMITIAAIVIMLGTAEAIVRVRQMLKYGSSATIVDYFTIDARTGLRVGIPNFSNGRTSINSLGFRGPEISVPKPPGTVRIAFLGASTTWCGEVLDNDHVWPHPVTASLSQAFPGARIDYVNAGVPGYRLSSTIKGLQFRVAPLQPDVILFYEAANDLSRELIELAVKRGIIADDANVRQHSWLARHSLLWELVLKNFMILRAQIIARANQGRLEFDPATLGEDYRRSLTQLVRAAQQHAKLVALATFSIHLRSDQSTEHHMRAAEFAFVYMPYVTPRQLIDSYARYNQIVREVAAETGALLIEGENDIPGDSIHFVDTFHFTNAGSKAMAERIYRGLVSSPSLRKLLSDNAAVR